MAKQRKTYGGGSVDDTDDTVETRGDVPVITPKPPERPLVELLQEVDYAYTDAHAAALDEEGRPLDPTVPAVPEDGVVETAPDVGEAPAPAANVAETPEMAGPGTLAAARQELKTKKGYTDAQVLSMNDGAVFDALLAMERQEVKTKYMADMAASVQPLVDPNAAPRLDPTFGTPLTSGESGYTRARRSVASTLPTT